MALSKGRSRKQTRKQKIESGREPTPNHKYDEERNPPPLLPLTEKQRDYLEVLCDPSIRAVVVTGFAGTGKTHMPSVVAADLYRQKKISEIIVGRAYVQTGKTSGYKPGSSYEKLYPYVRNVLDTIKKRIGDANYQIALRDGITGEIQVQEIESIRGRSFDKPSWLIIDESQQLTPDEMQSIITRPSDNCKIVLCGDVRQKDIKGESGLEWLTSFVKRHNIKGVATIDFSDPDDIVRGGLVKSVILGMVKDENGGNL